MIRKTAFFLLLWGTFLTLDAQTVPDAKRMEAIQTFLDGYNEQNYKKMQKPLFFIGKIVVTKKALKKELEPYFARFGKAQIDTVTFSSKYQYTAKLKLEKDSTERAFFSFIFGEKGNVQGFGFTQPTLIYPKVNQDKVNKLSFEEKKEKIAAFISKKHLSGDTKFNGCVHAFDHQETVFKGCFGEANFQSHEPLNEQSLFDIASCGKQFTAMAIMILQERGKLNYSDEITEYISDFPYSGITLDHLLTHTSGLPEYMGLLRKHWDKTGFATNYDVVELLKTHQPKVNFQPNEGFRYCNTGYVLLSIVIEKISGLTYSEFLNKNIFQPLEMDGTRVYNTRRSKGEIIDNCAHGYIYSSSKKSYVLPDSSEKYNHVIYMDPITGDGNISSNIIDLVKWDKALDNYTLVKKSTLDKAYSRHELNSGRKIGYGYGVFLKEGEQIERVVYHTGGWPGYLSVILRFVDQQKTIVVMTNNSYDDFLKLADGVAAIMLE